MNLPNKLTVIRICIVPFVIAAILLKFPCHWVAALVLFSLASITDTLDGQIARKRGMVTDFGKFADPLADKVLVFSVLICLLQAGMVGSLVVIVLLAREFLVTAVRLSAAAGGKVVPASFWAKAKTVSQMIATLVVMAACQVSAWLPEVLPASVLPYLGEGLFWVTAVFSIVSGVQYVIANFEFIRNAK